MKLAVDVGGTFTDVIAADEATGQLHVMKVSSTPQAPEEGLLDGITRIMSSRAIKAGDVSSIVHVGTIGSNLLLGQMGIPKPKVALITTAGFRDVIEIGRQNRSELYNVFFQRPKPLIPRNLRFEVTERTDAWGNILREPSLTDLREICKVLRDEKIETLAISFLNSYLNPKNETAAKQNLSQMLGNYVFASSEVDPEHREYERTSTTVVNAILAPILSRYLDIAAQRLNEAGISAPMQLLSSSGGLVDLQEAKRRPIITVESGPAAGVVGAAEIARALDAKWAISFDMGGTTAKAGSIVNYVPLVVPEIEVGGRAHTGRTISGSGYPIRTPSVDLAEVSAGGGTVVWSDEAGALRVGPLSAGATPGPACYGAGGENATITDANLVLGRLGSRLLGGEIDLNEELALKAIRKVAARTGMGPEETAGAAIELVNLHMAKAVDIVSLERGLDPHQFTLIAFGGAGPMHAAELADTVGIGRVIVPPYPGLFSSLGLLMADMKYTYVRGMLDEFEKLSEASVENSWQEMSERALEELQSRGVEHSRITMQRSLDLRYLGQGYELEIPAPTPFVKTPTREAFEQRHEAVYGYRHTGENLEVTALRLTAIIKIPKINLEEQRTGSRNDTRASGEVWFGNNRLTTRIHQRNALTRDDEVCGPAIIEEYDSTIVVPPSWKCRLTKASCLLLER